MPGRYILLIDAPTERRAATREALYDPEKYRIVRDTPAALLIVERDALVLDLAGRGCIVGQLFTPGRNGVLRTLPAGATDEIVASRGQHLIDRYWGGYVAVLDTAAGVDIVRSPFGWLPCLFAKLDGATVFASDVDLLTTSGLYTPAIDRAALARHLAAGDIRREETCLVGLSEVRGGDRWSSRGARTTLWSPWSFTGANGRLDDAREAERRLRDTATYCVGERTPHTLTTLLLISGGLDSSIIAACLAAKQRDFAGLTYVFDTPAGDERRFASLVAGRTGARLIEAMATNRNVDLMRSEAARLPRPIARSFEQRTNALLRDAAQQISAGAVVGGGGGDNLFCSLQSPAPVADCLLDPVGRPFFWATCRSVAEMTQASVPTVAWRAWRRARRPRAYRRALDVSLLSPAAIDLTHGALDHPWLAAPPGTLPGKAAHVALLIGAQGFVEDADPFARFAARAVLMAQPLVETCLRIPSWQWFDRGRNRAAARRAFEHDLPPEIVWRRTKGSPDSLLIALYETNKPLIRALLLDGLLDRYGLLDRHAIAAMIDDPRPMPDHTFARILQLVDVEAWTRAWSR